MVEISLKKIKNVSFVQARSIACYNHVIIVVIVCYSCHSLHIHAICGIRMYATFIVLDFARFHVIHAICGIRMYATFIVLDFARFQAWAETAPLELKNLKVCVIRLIPI